MAHDLTRTIPLTQDKVAVVDAADYDALAAFEWAAVQSNRMYTYYAQRTVWRDGKASAEYMHRVIMGVSAGGPRVDHRDGDGLNNTRSNLRFATTGQNQANAKLRSTNTSGYRGVHFDKSRPNRPWRAGIKSQGKLRSLGSYRTPVEAAEAYDRAALELHGEFARLNFPQKETPDQSPPTV